MKQLFFTLCLFGLFYPILSEAQSKRNSIGYFRSNAIYYSYGHLLKKYYSEYATTFMNDPGKEQDEYNKEVEMGLLNPSDPDFSTGTQTLDAFTFGGIMYQHKLGKYMRYRGSLSHTAIANTHTFRKQWSTDNGTPWFTDDNGYELRVSMTEQLNLLTISHGLTANIPVYKNIFLYTGAALDLNIGLRCTMEKHSEIIENWTESHWISSRTYAAKDYASFHGNGMLGVEYYASPISLFTQLDYGYKIIEPGMHYSDENEYSRRQIGYSAGVLYHFDTNTGPKPVN